MRMRKLAMTLSQLPRHPLKDAALEQACTRWGSSCKMGSINRYERAF